MSKFEHMAFGRHVIVDISHANVDALNNAELLISSLIHAVEDEGVTVLGTLKHSFTPDGVTILLLLAESHVSLHTYPGQGKAFFDAFTCGINYDPANIFHTFASNALPGHYRIMRMERGWIEDVVTSQA